MELYPIDRGIPFQVRRKNASRRYATARVLKVGESFFVPEVQSAVIPKKEGDKRRYSTRKENGGVRVWRVE